ncbi:hypothetical protein DPX16_16301 [Anabarilius grahami]|uniref:Uncharacterized protein n=1 Tax=Anabarilius grahami TaxID=495550 RepID=A0A3N0XK97_ANAGA|nr:hypothetical protein DPX16_16301 [Anabarilius grahami]
MKRDTMTNNLELMTNNRDSDQEQTRQPRTDSKQRSDNEMRMSSKESKESEFVNLQRKQSLYTSASPPPRRETRSVPNTEHPRGRSSLR